MVPNNSASARIKMSEYEIPFHIQEEIMKWLPVKSLVQFRIVSKAWKSLIDSSQFIVAHSLHSHTQPQHLLVSYECPEEEVTYVCFVDDETLPQQRPVPTFTQSINQLLDPNVVGISHGLVCLYGCHSSNPTTNNAVVWNPSIRKFIVVAAPLTPCAGFGVCPVTRDPKIVTIIQFWDKSDIETCYHCEVMVYTLSSGEWRSLSSNLPTKPVLNVWSVVVTDQFIHWLVELPARNMIMSFDLTSECFEVIDLPGSLAPPDPLKLQIAKLKQSLAILQSGINMISTAVWIMEGGVQRSFTKLFTIEASIIVGVRKSGVPIVQVEDEDGDEETKFVVYEPNLELNNVLQISGDPSVLSVTTYMESLFLLGRSDCSSY